MHFYQQGTGKSMYEVPYASPRKGMRPSTLKDAKKHGWVASVTTILQILDKPALNFWLQERVLESALTLPRTATETDKEYMARIKADSKEISLLARNEGSNIHDAIEHAFKGTVVDEKYKNVAYKARQDVYDYFKMADGWISEKSFAHKLGFGGKVDLHHPELNIVIDFKTKEEFKKTKTGKYVKMAYDEQCMQLSAYAQGLNMPDAAVLNVFVDYEGNTIFHEWEKPEVERCYKMFITCLELWKMQKNYDPCEFKIGE